VESDHLGRKESRMADEECCPEFDPTPWNGKTFEWRDKKFIKAKVRTFLYMPLNFGGVMRKLMKAVETVGVNTPDYLALSDHTSPWNMDVHVAVDANVQGAANETISGTFFSKVYEGSFRNTKAWCNDFEAAAVEKRLSIDKWYMWYTTCPKCAKKYGKNYVVIVGKTK
jgi:hypothetical protein